MADFKIGDVVYLNDEVVDRCKMVSSKETVLAPGQDCIIQLGLAKDIPLTIIGEYGYSAFYLTNFTDSWGTAQGKKYRTWILYGYEIEKREELNTVSLHELNRGL